MGLSAAARQTRGPSAAARGPSAAARAGLVANIPLLPFYTIAKS